MRGAAVYSFGEVLRGLRHEADVSILQARELTAYGNYERWESGQTRVGADHLDNIGVAFGVGNDLWQLVYAWLVDRFVPLPGCEPVDISGAELRRQLSRLPQREVDLGEYADMALGSLTHTDLAVAGVIARYGCGYAGDRRLVLAATERATVPTAPTDVPLLTRLYGDVLGDILRYVPRTFLLGGSRLLPDAPQRQVARYTWLVLSEPELLTRLAAAGAPPPGVRKRGLDWLAALAVRVAPLAQRLAYRQLEDLRRLSEAVEGAPVSIEDVKDMVRRNARDDVLWESPPSPEGLGELAESIDIDALPEPDPKAISVVIRISGRRKTGKLTYTEFVEQADDRAIRVGFEDARKAFGADVAQSYVNHLAGDDDGDDDGLREAFVTVSGLAIVKEVREQVDREADDLAERWFAEHRVAIKELPDERQQAVEEIRAEATEPLRGELKRPRSRMEDYAVVDEDGQPAIAPLASRHLMSDDSSQFPLSSLNQWEYEVLQSELARGSCRAWYRNPPRAAVDSLGVTYRDAVGNWRSMHPDFIFFNEVGAKIEVSIIDPHGHHLEDSLVKLQALARFAEEFGSEFHRIEALAKLGNQMRVLDLQQPHVRAGILASDSAP